MECDRIHLNFHGLEVIDCNLDHVRFEIVELFSPVYANRSIGEARKSRNVRMGGKMGNR